MSTAADDKIFWKVGTSTPEELSNCPDLFSSCLVPRMLAWLIINDESVSLLEGFSGGSYTPPSVFFAASAVPKEFMTKLRENKVCTISMATTREPPTSFQKASSCNWTEAPKSYSFEELGLEATKPKEAYPSAIATSPIQMFCSLDNYVTLGEVDAAGSDAMVVLLVESFRISGSVLSKPTEEMKKRPNVVAKIDAQLIRPVVALGHNGKICPLKSIRSMPRPVKSEEPAEGNGAKWTSTDFSELAESTPGPGGFDTAEWNFREHGGTSPLGYNALTALVMPRPIGWISTYYNNSGNDSPKLTHLAPYSFFCNVTRSAQCPMVAFSGFQRDGTIPKDAQNDAQQSGYFTYNMVTEDLAVPMNLSAAELGREESEFALAGLTVQKANLVDAPMVKDSPIQFECEYVKSVQNGSFCIVIGRVVGIHVSTSVLTDKSIDVAKLKAITRLGFMDEYGTLDLA